MTKLKAHRDALIEPKVAERKGCIVKLMGDGLLAEFPSAVEAVQCAVEIQHLIGAHNADIPKKNGSSIASASTLAISSLRTTTSTATG